MKKITRCLSVIIIFSLATATAYAQNNKYLVLEYIRPKPGITDSSSIIENTTERLKQQQKKKIIRFFKALFGRQLIQIIKIISM